MAEPSVSVVVAAWQDTAGLAECLESLASQRADGTEVIVVSSAPRAVELQQRFRDVAWLDAARDLPIPALWGLGMERAARDVVALTTAHFTPAADWVPVIRRSHSRLDSPAIGGPIDPPRGGGLVDWATYFMRYSAYARADREETRDDLAGDNASYKRAAVLAHPELLRDGFWEQEFHLRFRRAGGTLTFVPAMRVRQRTSFGFRRFLRQRFAHGRRFGRTRLQGRGAGARAVHVLASPLVPFILLAKISARVLRGGRDLVRFAAALPMLACFVLAWAAGEAAGYLGAGRARSRT
jgi:GT2 family glycosyltransferase